MTKELILEILEEYEDLAFALIADRRCAQKEETISHENLWNELLKNEKVIK